MARHISNYHPSVPVVMRLLKEGRLTIADGAEILQCSSRTLASIKEEFGISTVFIETRESRKEKTEANRKRNETLEALAKQVKYEGADIQLLAKENNIPSRTLYRWIHHV